MRDEHKFYIALIASSALLLAGIVAGIALALQRLFEATGEPRWANLANRALAYERALFSEPDDNWQDVRFDRDAHGFFAWCHGAPGIGLARLSTPDRLRDATCAAEIRAAVRRTRAKRERQR